MPKLISNRNNMDNCVDYSIYFSEFSINKLQNTPFTGKFVLLQPTRVDDKKEQVLYEQKRPKNKYCY